ncbi:MAG: hypothetical protein Q8P82_03050 [bacterium]|nr:hypothetical protein [bacterium]
MKNFGLSVLLALSTIGCGLDTADTGPECSVNSDCLEYGEYVCNYYGYCEPYRRSPGSDAGTTPAPTADLATPPATPAPFVARSGGGDVLQLNARYLSESDEALLLGEPLPFKWDRGPLSRIESKNGEKYYSFDFGTIGARASIVYRLSYLDGYVDGWAEYGGEKNFSELSTDAGNWLCQYVDDGGNCTTSIFVAYDGTNVWAAGRAVCAARQHKSWCPNLHK